MLRYPDSSGDLQPTNFALGYMVLVWCGVIHALALQHVVGLSRLGERNLGLTTLW